MKTITIAFDIDGTLRNNTKVDTIANEEIRTLLVILAGFKNTHIHAWSGGGEIYARQCVKMFGLDKYVDTYSSKTEYKNTVDIAIDDQHEFNLADKNLIVREK